MRIGLGYDVHKLVEGRKFLLGGVEIAFDKGLLGHSDADVLIHAVIDALIGAAGLGDIGRHFPPSDPSYKGISSMELLKRVVSLVRAEGFSVSNIDATVVLEAPRLTPYMGQICANVAGILGIKAGRVNVKAKTEEGLGFTGTGDGVSAYAVALLMEEDD